MEPTRLANGTELAVEVGTASVATTVNQNTGSDGARGFVLSQEELLAALLIAGLPAPLGTHELEAQCYGDLPEAFRPLLLAASERSLAARGFIDLTAQSTLVPEIQAVLATCAQPARSWLLVHQLRGQPERTTYIHHAAQLMAHTASAGLHQFIALNTLAEIRELAATLIDLGAIPAGGELGGVLAEPVFARVASEPRPEDALITHLTDAGLTGPTARAFAASMSQLTAITACARFEHQREPALQQVFTIVASPAGYWVVWPVSTDAVRLRQINTVTLATLLDRFAAPIAPARATA